jgi:hypothetical protein
MREPNLCRSYEMAPEHLHPRFNIPHKLWGCLFGDQQIWTESTVSMVWIAAKLQMRSCANVCQILRREKQQAPAAAPEKLSRYVALRWSEWVWCD